MTFDAKALLAEIRARHRDQMTANILERAENSTEPPAAQYLGENGSGEAVVEFATGETVTGDPIFNTQAQPGDLVLLGGGTVDQVSAWEPELEPEAAEEFNKIKILYRMPDGGLYIGGDRRVGRRIGTYNASASYQLANTGDGDNKWEASYTYADGSNTVVGWVGGRSVVLVNNVPSGVPSIQISPPVVSFVGWGYVLVQPGITSGRFDGSEGGVYPSGTRQLYGLQSDLSTSSSGALDHVFTGAENALVSLTTETTEALSSLLLNRAHTRIESSSYTYSFNVVYDILAQKEESYVIPAWTSPNATKSTTYSQVASDPITIEGSPDDEVLSSLAVSTSALGRKGGLWSETIINRVTEGGSIVSNTQSTTDYFNGIEVGGTEPAGFKRTIADNKLFALTLTTTELTTGGTAQVNVGRPANPWRLSSVKTSFFKIPANATVIDYSYHP